MSKRNQWLLLLVVVGLLWFFQKTEPQSPPTMEQKIVKSIEDQGDKCGSIWAMRRMKSYPGDEGLTYAVECARYGSLYIVVVRGEELVSTRLLLPGTNEKVSSN